jgi:hypothetical protein
MILTCNRPKVVKHDFGLGTHWSPKNCLDQSGDQHECEERDRTARRAPQCRKHDSEQAECPHPQEQKFADAPSTYLSDDQ